MVRYVRVKIQKKNGRRSVCAKKQYYAINMSVFELFGFSRGVRFVRPAVFPTLPLPSPETREGRRREQGGGGGDSEGWEGGHSIDTPRHSEGNHAKYFPLSVLRAPRLLLHTHTHIWSEKVLKVNTHTHRLGESVAHSHTHKSLWVLFFFGRLYVRLLCPSRSGQRAVAASVFLSVRRGSKSGNAIASAVSLQRVSS